MCTLYFGSIESFGLSILAGSLHYSRSALVKICRRGCVLGVLDGSLSRRGYTYHYIQMKLVARWKGDSRSHSPTIYLVFMVQLIHPFSNSRSQSRDAVNYPPKELPMINSPRSSQSRARIEWRSPETRWVVRSGQISVTLAPASEVSNFYAISARLATDVMNT